MLPFRIASQTAFQWHAAEMHDGIHAFGGADGGVHVGQIELQRLFVWPDVLDLGLISQSQGSGQRGQPPAQLGPQAARRAGDQDRVETRGHLASVRLATARAIRAMASVSTVSEVAVEMRKNGDTP